MGLYGDNGKENGNYRDYRDCIGGDIGVIFNLTTGTISDLPTVRAHTPKPLKSQNSTPITPSRSTYSESPHAKAFWQPVYLQRTRLELLAWQRKWRRLVRTAETVLGALGGLSKQAVVHYGYIWGNIGIMENKMEITIMGYIGIYWGYMV